jgi:hypothetical protein
LQKAKEEIETRFDRLVAAIKVYLESRDQIDKLKGELY